MEIIVKRVDEVTYPKELKCPSIRFATWDYGQGGTDWPEKFPDCTMPQQSPINLLQPRSNYGKAYKFYKPKTDGFNGNYFQLIGATLDKQIKNNRIKITINNSQQQDDLNGFVSNAGRMAFRAPNKWIASEVSFKHKSEHTVEGKRFDLELQVFHEVDTRAVSVTAENGTQERRLEENNSNENTVDENFIARAISIFFDTENYDNNLDK